MITVKKREKKSHWFTLFFLTVVSHGFNGNQKIKGLILCSVKPIPVWILKDNKVTNPKNQYNWAEPHLHVAQNSLAKSYPTLSCEHFQSLLHFNFHYFLSFLGAMQFKREQDVMSPSQKIKKQPQKKCVRSCCLLLDLQRRLISHEHVLLTGVEVN